MNEVLSVCFEISFISPPPPNFRCLYGRFDLLPWGLPFQCCNPGHYRLRKWVVRMYSVFLNRGNKSPVTGHEHLRQLRVSSTAFIPWSCRLRSIIKMQPVNGACHCTVVHFAAIRRFMHGYVLPCSAKHMFCHVCSLPTIGSTTRDSLWSQKRIDFTIQECSSRNLPEPQEGQLVGKCAYGVE